jgi:hypothetical protein
MLRFRIALANPHRSHFANCFFLSDKQSGLGLCSRQENIMGHIKGRQEPAYSVVKRLGGVAATARIIQVNASTVSRWILSGPGTTGGNIPQKYWPELLLWASHRGIDISLHDLAGL